MKKDRNCGMIPNYGGVMPGSAIPMPAMIGYPNYGMPNIPSGSTMNSFNNYDSSDLTGLANRINSLEQRVNRLENLVNNGNYSTGYNSSNYQMM